MKKKFLLLIGAVVTMLLFLTACGDASSSGSDGANEKQFISWVTGTTGGVWYNVGAAAASVISSNSQSVSLDVQATGASVENMKLLANGTVDLGSTTPDTGYFAYIGEREFDEPYPGLRTVMPGNMQFGYIIVKESSDYHNFTDLDGATISVGAPGSATRVLAETMAESFGIKFEDESLGHNEAVQALRDGNIDVMMAISGMPFPAVTELSMTEDIRFIELTEAEIEMFIQQNPYYNRYEMPANTYEGQDKPIIGVGVGTLTLADESLSDDAIYELLEVLLKDNHDEWVKGHDMAKEFSIESMENYLEQEIIKIPIHPGAAKFYEDNGIEIPEIE